jgi:hypothetical protein
VSRLLSIALVLAVAPGVACNDGPTAPSLPSLPLIMIAGVAVRILDGPNANRSAKPTARIRCTTCRWARSRSSSANLVT